MDFEWDEAKRQWTRSERGLDFADVASFDMGAAHTEQDRRKDYSEPRYISTGHLHGRLVVLCWTIRNERIRVISLRKANEREQKKHSRRS